MVSDKIVNDARELRHKLHAMPEKALHEVRTKAALMEFLKNKTGLKVVDCGQWFYAVYIADENKNPIAFRADFDAVEGKDGICGHFCGHDGHAAILAGLAEYIDQSKPENTVYLLFQPAEETGEGALICRDMLTEKSIKEIYGFHNIPGYPGNSILIREHTFACGSTGLELTFEGTPAHAAYPDSGRNPARAVAHLVMLGDRINTEKWQGLVLSTVIGIDLGSSAYGVSASRGVLRLTLRAEYSQDYQRLVKTYIEEAQRLAEEYGLKLSYRKVEEFAATENMPLQIDRIKKAARKLGRKMIFPEEPFRWSEDFGFYMQRIPGAYFGIGDGEDYPDLHTEKYTFPDEIIGGAIEMLASVIE